MKYWGLGTCVIWWIWCDMKTFVSLFQHYFVYVYIHLDTNYFYINNIYIHYIVRASVICWSALGGEDAVVWAGTYLEKRKRRTERTGTEHTERDWCTASNVILLMLLFCEDYILWACKMCCAACNGCSGERSHFEEVK